MKIIGISFSPRKVGNCEIAIKEIANHFEEKVDFEFIRIYDYNIKPCIACYKCLFSQEGKCSIEDDFFKVFEKIIDADGLIFAVPSYFLGPNSSFKVFIDRFLISYAFFDKIHDKPVILLTIAGVENGGEGYTDLALKSTAKVLGFKVIGSEILYSALPGEVLLKEENKVKLKKLAKLFFNSLKENEKEEKIKCNICGSNYFEFLDNGYVKCLVCKNRGRLVIEDNKFNIYIEEGELFFGSKEAKLKHKEWLKNMKERFMNERNKLMEIIKKYK